MPDTQPLIAPYEPPKVERVLTADELSREVLYAGGGQTAL